MEKKTYIVCGKKAIIDGKTLGEFVELTPERAAEIGSQYVCTEAEFIEMLRPYAGAYFGKKRGRQKKAVNE